MPDALTTITLQIYPGLGQAQEYAGLHTLVAWLPPGQLNENQKLLLLRSFCRLDEFLILHQQSQSTDL